MRNDAVKEYLIYVLLPFIMICVFLTQRGRQETIVLLLRETYITFGFIAAIKDFREKRVSNRLVLAMLGGWVLIIVPQLFLNVGSTLNLIMSGAIGFVIGSIVFLTVYYVSHKGLGGGDIKFIAVSGLYLGFEATMATMFFGSVFSALTGIALIIAKKIDKKGTIPLVPFLYIGSLFTIILG